MTDSTMIEILFCFVISIGLTALIIATYKLIYDVILEYKEWHEVSMSNIIWDAVLWVVGIVFLIVGICNIGG